MDPGVQCHGVKANPTGNLWSSMGGCQDLDSKKLYRKSDGSDDQGDYNSKYFVK